MATVPTFAPGVATTTTDLLFAEHGRPVGFAVAASQSVASGGWAALTFGTPALDRGSGFATPTYQAGNTLGLYRVTGQVQFAASTSGSVRGVRVVLNGGAVPGGCAEVPVSAASTPQAVPLPVTYLACTASTDVLTLQVLQDTGGSINVTGALSVEWQGEMGVISAPVGLITDTASIPTGPVPTPNTPTFGTFTAAATLAADGTSSSSITVTWIPTTTNTDSSTDTDGDHYEIQYRQTGTTAWTSVQADWSATSYAVLGLPLATSFDFQIRAVNGQGENAVPSAWSSTSTQTSATSTTPPGQPDAATVAASLIAVQVSHDLGLASGGSFDLPPNMDHLEVHFGTSSGFTPSGLTLVGKLQATRAMMVASIPAIGTFPTSSTATVWVKVIAVDSDGNRSTASPGASTTSTLIDDSHIGSLTASKITAGTITAAVIIGGSATFSGTLSGATGSFTGTVSTGTSGAVVTLNPVGEIDLQNASGASGNIKIDGSGNLTLTLAGGNYLNVGPSGVVSNTSLFANSILTNGITCNGVTCSGTISGTFSGTWSGAFSAGSISTSGTLSSTGSFTTYGTTTTINPSGAVNVTASTISETASSSWTVSSPGINLGGGTNAIGIGASGGTLNLYPATINVNNITTSTGTAIVESGRRLYISSSSLRYKTGVEDASINPADVLALRPITYLDKTRVQDNGGSTEGVPRFYGLIAEEIADGPLDALVHRDAEGLPQSVAYDRVPVLLLPLMRDLYDRVASLESR